MLYLLSILSEKFAFLSSIYLRVAVAFLISFLVMLTLGKPFITYLKKRKYGESIREDGPESHFSKKGTPTMGGVLIVFTILFTNFLAGNLMNRYTVLLVVVTLILSSIGFIDDYKKFTVNKRGLSGKKKLLGQFLVALIVWLFIVYLKPGGSDVMDISIVNPFMVDSYIPLSYIGSLIYMSVVILGASNAVNITDGLDGLATMPIVINSLIFAIIAYFSGHIILSGHLKLEYMKDMGEVTVFLSSVCGAGLGFLWYNFYPAQIFMGDTGSLTLGGILGTVAVLLRQELLLPIVGFIFVLEAMSVIIQVGSFKLTGKRVFKMAPIHHHYELKGQPETKVTMRFWIVTIMCGILALGLIRLKGAF